MSLPRAAHGRIVLAADVPPWLRPDANACPDRSFCHTFGRGESTRWCRADRTRSRLRWKPAGLRGRRSWTRSAWSPARTSPQ
ncbi:hypothetical protein ACFWWM_07950 [Streptomyces sp. NPDC058682]|uniref:hypothetical protein n=1 Tax=Streptomyces sp. NPDC058682 TaxID=3346596 RepID=UPI00365EE381